MHTRTFYRKILDIFFENSIVKTITSIVNFCNEMRYYSRKELKFFENLPLNNNVAKENYYKSRFIFNTNITNKTGLK